MNLYEKYEQAREEYLASLKIVTKSKDTHAEYAFTLDDFGKYVKTHGGEETEVPPLFIVGWRNEVKAARGLANNTLRHYLTLLHSFFEWTIEHKIFAEQPIGKGDFPKKEAVEYDLLSEQEIEKILSGEIPPHTPTPLRTRAIVFMFLLTGLRVSELAHLPVGNLDFDAGTVTVCGKGDKVRSSTLPKPLIKVLKEYMAAYDKTDGTAPLFSSTDKDGREKPFTRQNITNVVERYVNRLLGHKHIGAHDLRHSFASMLITNNCPLENIQQLLGHSNYATTVIYASHLCPKRIATEANSVFDAMPIFSDY